MNGLGLIVMGPWPQFTVALALTSALTSATAGTSRSKASWTDRAEEGEGMAARPALAVSTRAHRTLDARALIGVSDRHLNTPSRVGIGPRVADQTTHATPGVRLHDLEEHQAEGLVIAN